MTVIKYEIITKTKAAETLKRIAELADHHLDVGLNNILNKSDANLAALTGKWSLSDTRFLCLGLAQNETDLRSGWLYATPSVLKEQLGNKKQKLYLLVANYEDVATFDEDTPAKQKKFKNYSEEDIGCTLVDMAYRIAEGDVGDIPVSFVEGLPSKQVKEITQDSVDNPPHHEQF